MASAGAVTDQSVVKVMAEFKDLYNPSPTTTVAELGDSRGDYLEVRDRTRSNLIKHIERVILSVHRSIVSGNGYSFSVPSRASAYQEFVPKLNRIALKRHIVTRSSGDLKTARQAVLTLRVIEIVHDMLVNKNVMTERDVYYCDTHLFKNPSECYQIVDDVACMFSCTRISLNVSADGNGHVIGRLNYIAKDRCRVACAGGTAIPAVISQVTGMLTHVLFVLLVDKHTVFNRLAVANFHTRFNCLIVTSNGEPDVATRSFLKRLRTDFKLPILALMDGDPYGVRLLSVCAFGSKNMSYDGANLITPDIKWLGIRPSDLDKYHVPLEARSKMTDRDINSAKDLLNEDFVKNNPLWVEEITTMLERKEKAGFEVLNDKGFRYLIDYVLPKKLYDKDWL